MGGPPRLAVEENFVEAYTWPIGIVSRWFRAVAVSSPGALSRVELGAFPAKTTVFLKRLGEGEEDGQSRAGAHRRKGVLAIKAPKPNVGIIRATTADELDSLSMEQEAIYGSTLSTVEAVKASPGGLVLAQVLRVVTLGEIHPKHVAVPGPLVDYVVAARGGTETEKFRWQTASFDLNPVISGDAPYRAVM